MELRINTKGVGGKLPNFGFVVFDDSDPVQRILGAKVEGARIDFFSLPHFHSFGGGLVAPLQEFGFSLKLPMFFQTLCIKTFLKPVLTNNVNDKQYITNQHHTIVFHLAFFLITFKFGLYFLG